MPQVFNLVFPAYIEELSLDGYVFRRIENYRQVVRTLNHPRAYADEIAFEPTFGAHAVTADVTAPEPEPPAALGWANDAAPRLWDILLVLSLFTRRNVWLSEEGNLVGEHREYQYGSHLATELPSIIVDRGAMRLDIGFEPGLNWVLQLIRSEAWQRMYQRGHYLLMANHAFRWQILETTFTLCWTWEHVFALHNRHWLRKASLRRLPAREKLVFVASHYNLRSYDRLVDEETIARLAEIRNQLVHVGKFPMDSIAIADDFVEWTEYLIAATLNLHGGTFESREAYEASVR